MYNLAFILPFWELIRKCRKQGKESKVAFRANRFFMARLRSKYQYSASISTDRCNSFTFSFRKKVLSETDSGKTMHQLSFVRKTMMQKKVKQTERYELYFLKYKIFEKKCSITIFFAH